MSDNTVRIYTDGACSKNPGLGSWAAILTYQDERKEMYGVFKHSTNNRMEIMAVIKAVEALNDPINLDIKVEIYSDSRYVTDAFNKFWIDNWSRNGWKLADGAPVKNQDLWKRLQISLRKYNIKFIWVRSHANHTENNNADNLCKLAKLLPSKEWEVDYEFQGITVF